MKLWARRGLRAGSCGDRIDAVGNGCRYEGISTGSLLGLNPMTVFYYVAAVTMWIAEEELDGA